MTVRTCACGIIVSQEQGARPIKILKIKALKSRKALTMKINYISKKIEMTTAEAAKASNITSDLYKTLIEARNNFPEYSIEIVKTKKRTNDSLRGLTYEIMEQYIVDNGNAELLEELKSFRLKTDKKSNASSFVNARKWFTTVFPDFVTHQQKINNILASAKPFQKTVV